MCQKEIMEMLAKNPDKYFSSNKLANKLGYQPQQIARSMTKLIKSKFVLLKFIYKKENYVIRLIKIRQGGFKKNGK